jgi:hypothetical protein
MIPQLFVDLDGVLADFDLHFYETFGVWPKQDTYEPPGMWDSIRANQRFYRDLPMTLFGEYLWAACKEVHPDPIVLTGIPYSIPNVEQQKREWVAEHLGLEVKVITCRSVDKALHGKPGDVLVDDRLKYSKYWINMGGLFIHHQRATTTVNMLRQTYGQPPI